MRNGLLLALIGQILGGSPAFSQTIASSSFGAWQLNSFRNQATGQFNHCAASASYVSGISLLFSINNRFGWSIGFVKESWDLRPGVQIPIQYTVDGATMRYGSAEAISRRHVIMPLPDSASFFQQVRSGQMLTAIAGGQSFQFRLTGTSVVLQALLRCVNSNGADVSPQVQTAQPLAPAPAAPVQSAPPGAAASPSVEARLEATQFAANLLSHSGMRGFQILTLSELRSSDLPARIRTSDVVWRRDGVLGMLTVLSGRAATTLDRSAADIIADDARACAGEFATARSADSEMGNVRRLQTYCSGAGGTGSFNASYLLLPMPGGIAYQIATIGPSDRDGVGAEDQRVRDAVHSIIFRHPAVAPPTGESPQRETPTAPPARATKL
jgi:hypothetical protein